MALVKSSKRKNNVTKENRVQKQLRTRCMGHYKDQSRCHRTIPHTREQTAVYCSSHAYQASSADHVPRIRYCDGLTQTYEKCSARVSLNLPRDRPALCAAHEAQEHLHKSVQCFGVGDDGQRCTQQIPWESPFRKFCTSHENQESTFGCPITLLSDDASALILDLLKPQERIAFALSNKSCAGLVKGWNRGRKTSLPKPHMLVYRQHEHHRLGEGSGIHYDDDKMTQTHLHITHGDIPARLRFSQDFDCACVTHRTPVSYSVTISGSKWTNLTTIHDSPFPSNGLLLLRTMRAYPYLFGADLKRCVCCNAPLTARDSKHWSRAPAYKSQVISQRHEMHKIPEEANPETIFCKGCDAAGAKIELEWCHHCYGEPTVTAVARAYWSGQKEANEAETALEVALTQDTNTP